MKPRLEKAIKMANLQLVSWIIVLVSVFLSIFGFNSIAWAIIIIGGYAFQIFGAIYIYVITNREYGKKFLYYNVFMCNSILILTLISMGVIPTTDDNDTEYTIFFGSLFLVLLLYFFSAFLIVQLKDRLKYL